MADEFAAEDAIIARVKDQSQSMDQPPVVKGTLDLASMDERKQITPAVYVTYGGERVIESDTGQSGQGAFQMVDQVWYVVVAIRTAQDVKSGTTLRQKAGPYVEVVNGALGGFKPGKGLGNLKRTNAPGPQYSQGGFGYFTYAYTTRTKTCASN